MHIHSSFSMHACMHIERGHQPSRQRQHYATASERLKSRRKTVVSNVCLFALLLKPTLDNSPSSPVFQLCKCNLTVSASRQWLLNRWTQTPPLSSWPYLTPFKSLARSWIELKTIKKRATKERTEGARQHETNSESYRCIVYWKGLAPRLTMKSWRMSSPHSW
jgi:hypothetical protein